MHEHHVKIKRDINVEEFMKNVLFIILLSITCAQADSIFDRQNQNGDGSLTLEEERQAEGYVHEGLAQERYNEICKDGSETRSNTYDDICSNSDRAFGDGWGMIETMMPIVSKAYSAIGVAGLMGGGMDLFPLKATATENDLPVRVDGDGNEFSANAEGVYEDADGNAISRQEADSMDKKKENKKDFCAIIPGLTDMAANTMQTMENQQIQNGMQNPQEMSGGSPTRQAQAFYAMSRSHTARKKSSEVQAGGWGATAACYTLKMTGIPGIAEPYADPSTSIIVKLGLSAAVGLFYLKKSKVHGEKAELLKSLGDSFPKAGECNPHTETQCFCSNESSLAIDAANYQKYCVPLLFANRGKDADSAVPCIDANGQPDPECKCKKRRACIDTKLSQDAIRLGLDPSVLRSASQGINPLANGLAGAGLGAGIEEQLALARKALKRFPASKAPNLRGNKKAQGIAKSLTDLGIPAPAAALIASANIPVSGSSNVPALAAAGLRGDTLGNDKNAFKAAARDPRLKSGGSDNPSFKKGGTNNPFAMKKGRAQGGLEIQGDMSKLANRATMDADINKDTGAGLFEILSHRYKMRAWKEFEGSMTIEQE